MTFSDAQRSLNKTFCKARIKPECLEEIYGQMWANGLFSFLHVTVQRRARDPMSVEITFRLPELTVHEIVLCRDDHLKNWVFPEDIADARAALKTFLTHNQ